MKKADVSPNEDWGLDHGTRVLSRMFREADIPVVQLSLDYSRPGEEHYELAKEPAPLRRQGVLVVGSGNMVHNLRLVAWPEDGAELNASFGFDWALEANELFKKLTDERRHAELANTGRSGRRRRWRSRRRSTTCRCCMRLRCRRRETPSPTSTTGR